MRLLPRTFFFSQLYLLMYHIPTYYHQSPCVCGSVRHHFSKAFWHVTYPSLEVLASLAPLEVFVLLALLEVFVPLTPLLEVRALTGIIGVLATLVLHELLTCH